MVKATASPILHLIRCAVEDRRVRELPDEELLQRFSSQQDQDAFHALLRRHGPLVLDVCRGVLGNEADAEDAFQATFLILARKADSIRKRASLGSWLHGIAYRTALKARAQCAARHKHEARAPLRQGSEPDDLSWREVRQVLHEELNRLPERYRAPLVLCYLEAATHEAAAVQLRLAKSTLRERLERGRALLRTRLTRRGLGPAALLVATTWPAANAAASVPVSLMVSTVKAATSIAAGSAAASVVSAKVAAITDGVLKAMFLTKLKTVVTVLLAVSLIATGAGVFSFSTLAAQQEQATTEARPNLPHEADDKAKTPKEKNEHTTVKEAKQEKSETSAPKRGPGLSPGPEAALGEPPTDFNNSAGWSWYEAPHTRKAFGYSRGKWNDSEKGYSATVDETKDGALVVHLAFSTNKSVTAYRPVVFDSQRNRYPLKPDGGGGQNNVKMVRFRLDPKTLPANEVAYLGIEILTAEGRKLRAKDAIGRATNTGVEVLPFPEIGAVYEFVLTTMDGKKILSRDLRGKVVLIDAWATWCAPCMAKMPELKQLYEQHRKDGLEIVGVCFDRDADRARKTVTSKGLDWPQVLVPTDEKIRDLWEEATGIEALPRMLLLDRSGVLRADCGPRELKDQIAKLLKEPQAPDSRR